jgi:hypothetical protein
MLDMSKAGLRVAVSLTLLATVSPAQQAGSQALESTLPQLANSRYFVLPPVEPPKEGKGGLIVVLPGGDGSREFLPWVENGLLAQRPPDCVGVLVTAVKWKPDQKIVWPTDKNRVPDMQYTTEEYVRAVVDEVEKQFPSEPAARVIVGWSSSGPAVYPLLFTKDSPFSRGYVAMSVWPQKPGKLDAVKGRRFFLDQSPEDQVTPFRSVREAYAALTKAGAVVRVSVYEGGHGWQDEPIPRIREGLRWLLSDEPAPEPVWPEPKPASVDGVAVNLLANGDFEKGLSGWNTVGNSGRLRAVATKDEFAEGRQALHLAKAGGAPLDLVVQEVELPEGSEVTASVMVKSKGAKNAWIKVWLYGKDGEALHSDVDLLRVPADGEWQQVEKTWQHKGAVRATVQVILVLGGDVWIDDFRLTVAKE